MSLDVADILGELGRDRKDHDGIVATTMNLLVFVGDHTVRDLIAQRVASIAEKHPCRVLFLDDTHDSRKHVVQSDRSEHVNIGVKQISSEVLRSIVHALIVPNVQTVLLWAGRHTSADERFGSLAGISHCVVLDSSRTDATATGLRELMHYVASGGRSDVRDLAYMRLLPWQDMIAQFFDDPDLLAELPSIHEVEVVAGSEAEAYYLLGWLGSRLGWHPCGKNAFCNANGARIECALRREGEARRVVSVSLGAPSSTFAATLEKDETDLVCLTVTGAKARPKRCAPLRRVDVVTLIERAILVPEGDEVFRESFDMARTVLSFHASKS